MPFVSRPAGAGNPGPHELTQVMARRNSEHRAHGVVVSHPLSMREALGSIPSVPKQFMMALSLNAARPTRRPQNDLGGP